MMMEIEEKNQNKQFISLDNLLEILGNPTRRIILSKLAKVPHSASELSKILGISRQAVHSQLEILGSSNILERIGDEKRGSLKDIGCSIKYENIKTPDNKIRFLGEQIRDIENGIKNLEGERRKLLQNKECFIIELKNIINRTYQKHFLKPKAEVENLEREIFYTLFYNPVQFRKRISIDNLMDRLFFSDLDPFTRESKIGDVKSLLRDMSSFMDFLWEDDDDWFFDF